MVTPFLQSGQEVFCPAYAESTARDLPQSGDLKRISAMHLSLQPHDIPPAALEKPRKQRQFWSKETALVTRVIKKQSHLHKTESTLPQRRILPMNNMREKSFPPHQIIPQPLPP